MKKLFIIVGIVIVVGVGGLFIYEMFTVCCAPGPPSKGGDTRAEVNGVLAGAGLNTIEEWMAHPECGPTDQFYGTYGVSNSNTTFSREQAKQLVKYVEESSLKIDYYGQRLDPPVENFSFEEDNWQIAVLYRNDNVSLRITISSLEDLPDGLSASSSRCG